MSRQNIFFGVGSFWTLRPALLIMGLFVAFSLGTAFVSMGEKRSSSQEAVPVTSGGYSIFPETMVDMTWPEVEKAAKEGAIVLMTTAVIEEHGPHMTCGIDTYLG